MNSIGRPTDDEIARLEALADKYFVRDRWAIEARLWDDGDVHMCAYSTIGTGDIDAYPDEVFNHQQVIEYERGDGAVYINRLELKCEKHKAANVRELNRFGIDFR